jgi:Mg-chelatase subunit ChlD
MRKLLTSIAVFAIILMQVQGVFGLLQPQTAVAQEEQVILDNDAARVSVTSEVVSDTIEWTLQYAKHAPDDVQMRSIRIKLAEAEDGTGTVQRKEGDLNQADGDDWYREAEFTNSSEGKLIVTTPTTAKQLVVWLQIDSQTMGKTTTDLLTGTDAEAKVVPAPEIPVVEEESKEEAADVDAEEEEAIVVDQTPVDVGKPELTEVPEVKDEAEQKVAEEKRQAAEAHLAYAAPILLERVGSGSDQDQFTYVSEDDGTYPQDATDKHLPDGQNDNVRNYDYSNDKLETTNTKVNSILNTESDFANGYTTYSGGESADAYNVYTKKSVRPTSNENEYEIQLDVIGDAIESLPALDVVLVLDKSGSMHDDKATETRWEKLQQAVTSFSTELLDRGNDVQIGMTVFGGTTGDVSTGVPYAEIAAFSNLDDDDKDDAEFMGFTRNASDLTDHTAFSKNTPIGGTPTFLGLDAGLNLLWNTKLGARNDVAKVIITITDGEPTFSPQDTDNDGYSKDEDGELRTVQGSLNQSDHEINGDSLRYVLKNETGKSNNYTGNGTNNTHSASKTIAHVESRYGGKFQVQVSHF